MTDPTPDAEPPARQPARDPRAAITTVEIAALGVGVLWLAALAVGFLTLEAGGGLVAALRVVLVAAGVFLPLAVIALTTIAVRSVLALRDEVTRLQITAESLRKAQTSHAQAATTLRGGHAAAARPQAQAAAPRPAEPRPQPARPQPAPQAPPAAESQPALALESASGEAPGTIDPADFVRALDFPATPEDREGFRALRRARADPRAAELIQASQDLLTLLSEDGIYMDDLAPETAPSEAWRRFARGERGRSMAEIGGIRDEALLEAVTARMRRDTIFRDTAHHFLRRFDQVVSEFAPHATDDEIVALADTRTARAFMLIAQASGTFD